MIDSIENCKLYWVIIDNIYNYIIIIIIYLNNGYNCISNKYYNTLKFKNEMGNKKIILFNI